MKTAIDAHLQQAYKKRVLVVEEDFLTRWEIAEYLREIGFSVVEAVNVSEARAVLAAVTTIDAIVCSVSPNPPSEGRAFLEWLKHEYHQLPVIFTSVDPAAADLVREASAHRFVPKPYLLRSIENELTQLVADPPGRLSDSADS